MDGHLRTNVPRRPRPADRHGWWVVSIASLCKAGRERTGLTLDEAADAVGCTKSYLWELENAKQTNPGLWIASRLCLVYTINPAALIAAAEKPSR